MKMELLHLLYTLFDRYPQIGMLDCVARLYICCCYLGVLFLQVRILLTLVEAKYILYCFLGISPIGVSLLQLHCAST